MYVNIFGALLTQGYRTIYRQLYRDSRTIKTNAFPPRKKNSQTKEKQNISKCLGVCFRTKKSKKREVIMRLVSSQF